MTIRPVWVYATGLSESGMRTAYLLVMAVLACVGCQTVVPGGKPARPERVLAGSVTAVNDRVARAYKEVGATGGACAAWTDEHGDGMSVVGETMEGRRFKLMLRQTGKKTTRASVVWDGKTDGEFEQKLLTALARE